MFSFQSFLLIVSLITLLYSSFFGQLSFNFLIKQQASIDQAIIFSVIAISFMQYSLQYWKEIYQSIHRTTLFLSILLVELILIILVYFFFEIDSLKSVVLMILIVTSIPFFLASLLTIKLNYQHRSNV